MEIKIPFDSKARPQDKHAIKNLPVRRSIASESAMARQMPYLRVFVMPMQAATMDELKAMKKK